MDAVTAYWSFGSAKRIFWFEAVAETAMWPERHSAYPPAEVEKVGFEKPAVLLKGLLGFDAQGLASEPAMRKA
jgi:hypothetical protein